MGPSWPNCSLVLCTWPMKSIKPSPDFGTPCSGQSVNWNCRTVRDWPSWNEVSGGHGWFSAQAGLPAHLLSPANPTLQPSPSPAPFPAACPGDLQSVSI